MPTLKDDLVETFKFLYGEVATIPYPLPMEDAEAWHAEIMTVLLRHPYDLMQLATVRKVNPNIDTLPTPERDASAADYFKDDPQGKGW